MVKVDVPLPFNANFVSVCLKKDNDFFCEGLQTASSVAVVARGALV